MNLEGKSLVSVIAVGLDASTDGRGFTGEHKAACDLANAAPDLLAALEAIAGHLTGHSKPTTAQLNEMQRTARAAIARAKGEA